MTLTESIAAGLAATTVAVGLAVVLISKEPPVDPGVKSARDEYAAGLIPPYTVYRLKNTDGGFNYVREIRKNNSDETTYLDGTVCAMRPSLGADACTFTDGGRPGVGNVMQAGTWVGPDCVPAPCVVFAGDTF